MNLALMMEAIPGSVALTDPQGRLDLVNSSWREAPPGNPFLEGMTPGADYLRHCQALAKSVDGNLSLVATGIVSALGGKLKRLRLEYPVPHEGTIRWYAVSLTSGGPDMGNGTIIAHLDITERMQWEKKLRRTDQLFKATTEHALDLMAILGTDGRALYASPSYGKALGFPTGNRMDWKPSDEVLEEDRPCFLESCQTGFKVGICPLFAYRVRHRDGTIRHLEAQAVAVEDSAGGLESILLMSRDVSEQKEAERQRARLELELRHAQKMEAIGQLAAGIAHEINTPCQYLSDNMGFLAEAFESFQKVLACLDPLLREAPPGLDLSGLKAKLAEEDLDYLMEEVPRAIAQSRDGLTRISTIVRAMKIFGHPGTTGMAAVNLNEALENTLVVAQSEWKYLADVHTDLAPDLPMVVGSPGELNQVFLNLIVNAAHAIAEKADSGKGGITVATRVVGADAEIRITDTGAGIPEAIRERIFLPFFTTKEVGKGTGQGLAIAHSVIAKHRGSIDFESQVGVGTCFIIRLPMAGPA